MGEIAEMILDGILDCETGEYLGDAVGYPRTMNRHNERARKVSKPKVNKEVQSITNMCSHRGIDYETQLYLMDVYICHKGIEPIPPLDEQYKLIHSKYKNDFRDFLITYIEYQKGKKIFE